MGAWAEHEFGVKKLPPRAYLFAGTSSKAKIEATISTFNKVLFHRHDVCERYLVSGGDATVIFQLYGAPILCDLVTVLKDGGVKEVIFLGYAFGIVDDMHIGDCVVPSIVQSLDGVTARIGAGTHCMPDTDLTATISEVLQQSGVPFRSGKSVSVPATFWHGDESAIEADVIALEMEFAAFCHCARITGIKAAGLFEISDTKRQGLLDKGLPRDSMMLDAFRAIKACWDR